MTSWPDSGFDEPPLAYTPPPVQDNADQLARLRLIRSRRVGPSTYLRLMAEHGSADRALAALPDVAEAAGVRDYAVCPPEVAHSEWRAARRLGARLLTLGDAEYPAALAGLADAPPILWAIGDVALLNRPTVAIVGTRNASALGNRMAKRLAADLGEAGFAVVSGLARGIDTLVHRATLDTGTIAVQAGGLDVIYPKENADLTAEIRRKGVCLSERPFGLAPQARDFPRRNRIVSGLAQAVIVIEAAARSGSLITAGCALDQGRDVMAVPGHPFDSRAAGCNILIRDGATLVRSASDVLEALSVPAPAPAPVAEATAIPDVAAHPATAPTSGGVEALILAQLGPSPVAEDQVVRAVQKSTREVAQALAILELAGRITRSAGGMVARAR